MESINARKFKDGDWYWIHKEIIRTYAPKIRPSGVAVYNVLASMVNQSQHCYPSQRYIAERLGYSRASVSRAIKMLSTEGLISLDRRKGNSCVYHLLKPSSLTGATGETHRRKRDVAPEDTNNKERKTNNNNRTDFALHDSTGGNPTVGVNPQTNDELLAYDLAKGLDDLKSIQTYSSYTKQYRESLLRRILSEVKSVPLNKIKKSRAALFHYLLRING